MDTALLNRLRYRRQFILGPRPVALAGVWHTHQLDSRWVLTRHADLPFRSAQTADGAQLALLGFIIDPEFPGLDDDALLKRLAQCRGWDTLLRATIELSGRWILFHLSQDRLRVVNDATGLRAVFFSGPGQEPWCFSQPGLYRHVRPLEYSAEGRQFVAAKECQKDLEVSWPGTSTPYAEVEHLLPNHYLDLTARTTMRFWPTEKLEPQELQAVVPEASRLLRQSLQAIAARGPFGLALTAGWDSRPLLAASRPVISQVWLHTAVHGELDLNSHDIRIPTAMCRLFGAEYHLLRCPQIMAEPFQSVFLNNNDPAHPVWGRICQGMLESYPSDLIAVRGNVSETARCFYYKKGNYPASVTADDLPRMAKMPVSDFTRRHFGAWHADARSIPELGYKLLDFFYWENRMANWLGASHTEYDVIHDTFSPYSNRRLMSLLLSTPAEARCKPRCTLYRQLIEHLWPELLEYPINPPESRLAALSHKLRKARRQVQTLLGQRAGRVRLEATSSPAVSPQ